MSGRRRKGGIVAHPGPVPFAEPVRECPARCRSLEDGHGRAPSIRLAPKTIAIGRELLDARVGGRSSMIILPSGFGLRGEGGCGPGFHPGIWQDLIPAKPAERFGVSRETLCLQPAATRGSRVLWRLGWTQSFPSSRAGAEPGRGAEGTGPRPRLHTAPRTGFRPSPARALRLRSAPG